MCWIHTWMSKQLSGVSSSSPHRHRIKHSGLSGLHSKHSKPLHHLTTPKSHSLWKIKPFCFFSAKKTKTQQHKTSMRSVRRPRQVQVFTSTPDDLSSIPRTSQMRRRGPTPTSSPDFHTHSHDTHVLTTHKYTFKPFRLMHLFCSFLIFLDYEEI